MLVEYDRYVDRFVCCFDQFAEHFVDFDMLCIEIATNQHSDQNKVSRRCVGFLIIYNYLYIYPCIWFQFLVVTICIGISTVSLLLESVRLAILWAYNYCHGYNIFTYLEYPFLLLQQTMLFHIVVTHRDTSELKATAIALSIFLSVFVFIFGVLPKGILSYLLVVYYWFC